jgi:uncharacterized cupin superfamily protein
VKRIINLAEVPTRPVSHGDRFEATAGRVAEQLGARQLGCTVMVVPPGKRAYPIHRHHINEEMFVVLDGTGEARLGDEVHPIRAGDVIACLAGGEAHQLINTGATDLRYLSISTTIDHDVIDYPDSGKILVWTPEMSFRGKLGEPAKDYWEGE